MRRRLVLDARRRRAHARIDKTDEAEAERPGLVVVVIANAGAA
jgi:hypothetical protein